MSKVLIKSALGLLLLFLYCGFPTEVMAQSPADKNGAMTIPWDEFKHLLNLDKDEFLIPLETFQKLLAQTGVTSAPPYSMQGGHVILSRAEFANLVNQMKPPIPIAGTIPFEYLVTKSIYTGTILEGGSTFKATFVVHVLKKNSYIKVPILPQGVALENVTIDGVQTLVVSENGYHNVVLSGSGEYIITATFSIKSSLHSGPSRVELAIMPTPITLLKLEIPLPNLEFEIPEARKIQTGSTANGTTVNAVISQGFSIGIQWRKKIAPSDKIPSKLYAELNHLISIEDDALKVSADINLNILYNEINEVQLVIPANVNVLSVAGEGIGEWQEVLERGRRILRVPFTYGKKGQVWLRVMLESALSESGLTNEYSGIQVLEAVRETGFIGIELNTSAEVLVVNNNGLEPVAVQKLPSQLINQSTKPLMFGFRNLKQPYGLILDVKKHIKVAVPMATISSGNVVTLFTEDGKIVNRLVYQVRNNAKQFLEITIPSNADVWSVFVDGKPVESSINSDGKLLVPLIKSRANGEQLETFPVEIIYCLVQDEFSWMSSMESSLPAVDLLVSQLIWSVYLPNDYTYHHFASTLEMEEMINKLNLLSNNDRRYNEEAMKEISQLLPIESDAGYIDKMKKIYDGKELASTFRNIPLKDEEIVGQLNAELEFGGRMERLAENAAPASISGGSTTGVLPIQIRIPTTGQVYRFAKTIIKPEDSLSFKVTYSSSWVTSALKWIMAIIVLALCYFSRRQIGSLLRWIWNRIAKLTLLFQSNRKALDRFFHSPMAPVVFLGLAFVSWPFSLILSLLFAFLFWIGASYQIMEFWKRRMLVRAAIKVQQSKENNSK